MELNLINKIYICHYTKLVERVDILKEQLDKYQLEAEWILTQDKEDLDIDKLKENFINIDNYFNLPGHYRKLRLGEISCLLKHYEIWKDMKLNKIENALVLEDDALLSDNFVTLFNENTKDIDENYDIVWVGSCCNLHVNSLAYINFNKPIVYSNTPSNNLFKTNSSRCTHGYMLNLKVVDILLENVKYNNYPVDFYFSHIIDKLNLNNYWMEPDLISQNPKFETSIQNG